MPSTYNVQITPQAQQQMEEIVDYIDGKNDTARAFYVTVLPKKPVTINPEDNKNKKLITSPE